MACIEEIIPSDLDSSPEKFEKMSLESQDSSPEKFEKMSLESQDSSPEKFEKMSLESQSEEYEANYDEDFQEFAFISMDLFDPDEKYDNLHRNSDSETKKDTVYSSSDEEELVLTEAGQEKLRKYKRQIISSGGFDLDSIPGSFVGPFVALAPDEDYEEVCRFSKLAIEEYNRGHNTNYEFVKYVKGVWSLVAGCNYYLTFEAKEASDEDPTTFQGLVYDGIPDRDGNENVEVVLVRMKSCAKIEDNDILLC